MSYKKNINNIKKSESNASDFWIFDVFCAHSFLARFSASLNSGIGSN